MSTDQKRETTAYVTKYALSEGAIRKFDGVVKDEKYFIYRLNGGPSYGAFIPKPHWHENLDDAKQQVLKQIVKKRASLKKQLKKLDELEAFFKG